MRIEVDRKLAADAVLGDIGFKHFPWQADRLTVFSDHPHPIILRSIKSARLVLADRQTEDSKRHLTSLSAATAKSEKQDIAHVKLELLSCREDVTSAVRLGSTSDLPIAQNGSSRAVGSPFHLS